MSENPSEEGIDRTVRAFTETPSDLHEQAVVDLLGHDEQQVQTTALLVLEDHLENPRPAGRLLKPVVARSTDSEPKVRNAARTVLTRLAEVCSENNESLPGVEPLLSHESVDVRRDAHHAAKIASEPYPGVLAGHVPEFSARLTDPDTEVRYVAALILGALAKACPDEIADHLPMLVDRLETDDVLVKNAVVRAIARISTHRPQPVVDWVPLLHSELIEGVVETEPLVETLANVAEVAPTAVRDVTPDLVELATRPTDRAKRNDRATSMEMVRENEDRLRQEAARVDALSTLSSITEHHPDVITPHLGALTPLLTARSERLHPEALDILRSLGIERPRTLETTVPELLEQLREAPADDDLTRVRQTLVEFGESSPDIFSQVLESYIDTLVDLLEHDDASVRGCAAGFLTYVAERNLTAVPADEAIIALLDDSNPVVRGNAALLLGLSGTDDARVALATFTPNEEFVEEAVDQALVQLN